MSTVLVYSSPGRAVLFNAGRLKDEDCTAVIPESTTVTMYPRDKQQFGPSEHKNGGNVI